jgi:hypothetical protein
MKNKILHNYIKIRDMQFIYKTCNKWRVKLIIYGTRISLLKAFVIYIYIYFKCVYKIINIAEDMTV